MKRLHLPAPLTVLRFHHRKRAQVIKQSVLPDIKMVAPSRQQGGGLAFRVALVGNLFGSQ